MADSSKVSTAPGTSKPSSSLTHSPPTPLAEPAAKRLRTIAAEILPALKDLDGADVSRVMANVFELRKAKERETRARLVKEDEALAKLVLDDFDLGYAVDIFMGAMDPTPIPMKKFDNYYQHMGTTTDHIFTLRESVRQLVVQVKGLNTLLFTLSGRARGPEAHSIKVNGRWIFEGISPELSKGGLLTRKPLEKGQSNLLEITLGAIYEDSVYSKYFGLSIRKLAEKSSSPDKVELSQCFNVLEAISSQLTLYATLLLLLCHCLKLNSDGGDKEKGRADAQYLAVDYGSLSELRYGVIPVTKRRGYELKYHGNQSSEKALVWALKHELKKWNILTVDWVLWDWECCMQI